MAKVLMPLLSGSASGKFANAMVFQKNGRVREYVIPANPQTTGQMLVRNTLGDLQRELKLLGLVLRGELRMGLGPTWNAQIIKELTDNGNAALDAYEAEFGAFGGTDQSDWAVQDTSVKTLLTDGAVLYAVTSAIYDMCLRLGVAVSLTLPIATNESVVKAEFIANS